MLKIPGVSDYVLYATINRGYRIVNNVNEETAPYPDNRYEFEHMTPYNTYVVDYSTTPPRVRTLYDWHRNVAPTFGISLSVRSIISRLESGWSFQSAIQYTAHERPDSLHNRFREKRVIGDQCKTTKEWCDEYRISPYTVFKRMREGQSFDVALTTPQGKTGPKGRLFEYNGETHTLAEWSDITHIPVGTLYNRLYQGWELGEALGTPVERRRQRL